MSIPVSIDPLGTLGAVARKPSGYVEDGLVFWLDVLADGAGTRSNLTELVSAKKVPCVITGYEPPIVGVDGVLRGAMQIPFGDFVAGLGYYVELVGCPWDKRVSVGAFATQYSETYSGNFPQVGFEDKNNAFIYRPPSTGAYRCAIPSGRIGRVSTFVYASATDAPKCEGSVLAIGLISGVVANGIVASRNARFCALRIYNRQLSASEAAQNLARDAERWDKNTIIN